MQYIDRFLPYREKKKQLGETARQLLTGAHSARENSYFRRLLLAVHPHLAALVGRVAGTRKKKQPADGFC